MALLDWTGFAAMPQNPYAAFMDKTSISEALRPSEDDPYEAYASLLSSFAPQYQEPSKEWRKKAMGEALLQFAAGMLTGENFSQGLGRGMGAFGESFGRAKSEEQNRLDLRAREDALSKYRGLTALASMTRAERAGSEKAGGVEPEAERLYTALMKAAGDNEEFQEIIEAAGYDIPALRAVHKAMYPQAFSPEDEEVSAGMDLNDWDKNTGPSGEVFYTHPAFPGQQIKAGGQARIPTPAQPNPLLDIGRLSSIGEDNPQFTQLVQGMIAQMLAEYLGIPVDQLQSGDMEQLLLQKKQELGLE